MKIQTRPKHRSCAIIIKQLSAAPSAKYSTNYCAGNMQLSGTQTAPIRFTDTYYFELSLYSSKGVTEVFHTNPIEVGAQGVLGIPSLSERLFVGAGDIVSLGLVADCELSQLAQRKWLLVGLASASAAAWEFHWNITSPPLSRLLMP